MKTTRIFILRNSLFAFLALLLAFTASRANAQSADAQASSTQAVTAPTKPAARITAAIDDLKLVPMQSRVHPLARPEFDRGVVADSQPMNRMMLVLKRSDAQEAALTELMSEQQTRNSANYHAWLSPTQFGQQFGVADADVQALTAWLTQKGFTGIKLHTGGMLLEFSGTSGKVRSAFHTEIHQFLVDGELHIANVSTPQMPAAFAPVVASVHTLHNFRKKSSLHFSKALQQAKANAAAEGTQFTFNQICPLPNGTQPCAAVAPGDFAKIYNLPANLDGTGQTIALVARSNVQISDINQFGTGFGVSNLTNFSAANNVVLTGPDPGLMAGDQDEATLDVEWSGAVAPKAKILLVPSDSQGSTLTDGVDLSSLFIIENNLAQIMSQSFGACEQGDPFESTVFEQAAAQGITVLVSTGDTGSAACDPDLFRDASDMGLAISGSASTSFNVAVGGTDFDDATNPAMFWNTSNSGTGLGSAKSYIPETTWNGGCAATATSATLNTACASINPDPNLNDPIGPDLSGGGGGQSNCATLNAGNCVPNPKPPFQQLAGLTGMPADLVRDIPDVSLYAAVNTASNNFYIICEASTPLQNGQPCVVSGANLNFSGVGGTSASTPAFAGIVALVNQNEVNNSRLKAAEGQGNINYVLYKLAVAQYANAGLNCNSSAGPAAGCTFNDVTKGNNSVSCVGGAPNCSTQTTGKVGVLVETSSATTPGWSTTPGYDLATGLGSVNVSNLVTNWPTVVTNFKPSTTKVTSTTPSPITSVGHGSNITFNISVTGTGGTPAGDVSLVPSEPLSSTGTIAATLTGGTASITTNQLPGGTYTVTVHYAGDGTFAASDSAPVSITVNKENSSSATSMWEYWTTNPAVLSPASAPYGSFYLFRVDVIGSQGQDNQQCTTALTNSVIIPCPTGKVTFTADGNPLNDFFGNGGPATNAAILNPFGFIEDRVLGSTGLSAGAHSIVASYAGDNSYNASAAPALPITITQAPTQTQVIATVNGTAATTVASGQSVLLTVGIGTRNAATNGVSAGAGPTGSVILSSCGTAKASPCTLALTPIAATNSNGGATATATLTTAFTTAGPQTITATYAGDTNYTGCTANGTPTGCVVTAASFTVTSPGTVAVASIPLTLSSLTGAAAGSTITVTPSGGFTGNVVVTATAASLPAGVTCPNSPLTINVTGATAVTGTLNCQVTATSTTFTASNFRERRVLEAKAIPPATTDRNPRPTSSKGWWTLSAGTGFAALFLFFLPGGRKRLHAALGLGLVCLLAFTLGCNGVGSGTPPPVKTATVTKLTVTSAKVASPAPFSFSVAVTGGTPTGSVQLFDGATMIGTAATVSGGAATPTAPALSVGTHAISAQYLGDSTTLASQSGAINMTVTGNTTIAITTAPAATPAASPITVTVN